MLAKELTRRTINTVCDAILPVPSLDPYASTMATKCVRENIRDQLIGLKMVPSDANTDRLIQYVSSREASAFVKDDKEVGAVTAEGMSVTLNQMSQDAFKAVEQNAVLGSVADKIKAILTCVQDRSDQKVTTHFDPAYSPEGGFSLKEVIAMRSRFVRKYISDLILPDGAVIGVMDGFTGDKVSQDVMDQRDTAIKTNGATILKPGIWNKLQAKLNPKSSIHTLRLYLDRAAMYAAGITMNKLVDILNHQSGEEIADKIFIIASSFSDAIIDIMPVDKSLYEAMDVATAEIIFLRVVVQSLDSLLVTGLEKVQRMQPVQVDLPSLITAYKPADAYRTAEHGRQKWLQRNKLSLTWDQVEYNAWLTDQPRENDLILGTVNDLTCIIATDNPDLPQASEEQLTNIYIRKISKTGLKNLWVLTLNFVDMGTKCIGDDLMVRMFQYCGLKIIHVANHQIVDRPAYLYVRSEVNPKDVLDAYFGTINFDTIYKPVNGGYESILGGVAPTSFFYKLRIAIQDRTIEQVEDLLSVSFFTILKFDLEGQMLPLDEFRQVYDKYLQTHNVPVALMLMHLEKEVGGGLGKDVFMARVEALLRVPFNSILKYGFDGRLQPLDNFGEVYRQYLRSGLSRAQMMAMLQLQVNFETIAKGVLKSAKFNIYDYEGNYEPGTIRPLKEPVLSPAIVEYLAERATSVDKLKKLLEDPMSELERLRKYVYAVMDVDKKDTNKGKTPIHDHVMPHAYSQIIAFPFVDRTKTISNDWFNATHALGVEIAKNNYIIEPLMLMVECKASSDQRHLALYGEYVFESGFPSGSGIYGQHGQGVVTKIGIEQAVPQLKMSFIRPPESVITTAVATYTGAPLLRGTTKYKQIAQMERLQSIEKLRAEIRYGKRKTITENNLPVEATNDDAINLAVRALMAEVDPYMTVPTLNLETKMNLPYPDEIIIDVTYSATKILRRINKGSEERAAKLSNIRPFKFVQIARPILPASINLIDIDVLLTFIGNEPTSFIRF